LFVAKRLVKHDVLGAGLNVDAAVHGQDADQRRFEFVRVHDELAGTLFHRRPAWADGRGVLRIGLTPDAGQQHSRAA
jgi:hypothetical protein